MLMPVFVSDAASTVSPVRQEYTTSHPRQKRRDVRIGLSRRRRVHVDSDIEAEALGRIFGPRAGAAMIPVPFSVEV